MAIRRGSSPDSNPFNSNKKGDTGDAGDTLRRCSADGRDDGIPASLRRCEHCNKNGELGHIALGDRPMVWLHRECEAAWLERMAITRVPPHFR
jgi:hypothetical protein